MSALLSDFVACHSAALTCRHSDRFLSRAAILVTLAIHLAGLAAVWRFFQQPIWFALPTLALLLLLPILAAWRERRSVAVETLAPFFFLYAVLLARVITIWFVQAPLPYQDESTLANARLLVFQIDLAVIAAFAYTAFAQIIRLTGHSARPIRVLALGLGISALAWFAIETIGHRTRGVTATDPYAYVQMAVDLAARGTPLHAFPLFDDVKNLGIQWYPIQHIGYRLFDNATGNAATVWPFGGSLWLAALDRMVGEAGLYLATPIAALGSLLVCAFLAWDFFRERSMIERMAIASIAIMLLATSWEQVDRSLVPLVDAQAQLFSTLAILLALWVMRSCHSIMLGAATGLALGIAYWIRHTQVLLVVPVIVAAWQMPTRARIKFLAAFGLASLLVASPDLVYHQINFGSWLTPESHELALFGFSSIVTSAQVIADRFFAGNEFGYLFPFLIYGMYRAARENLSRFAVLASWLIVLVGFHLFYEALRMRDLLPEFPALVLLTAYGIVALVRDILPPLSKTGGSSPRHLHRTACVAVQVSEAERGGRGGGLRQMLAAATIFLAALLFLTRTQFTLMRVVKPAQVTFGYVTAAQRASFDQIGALTPGNAVVGSTMNDGAIDLYTQRATFRPGDWSADELNRFVEAMRGAGRCVYLLDDGVETSAARRDLAKQYNLKQIVVLDVPLFGVVDGTPGTLWEIVQ